MSSFCLGDYCCQGGGRILDSSSFTTSDLVLAVQGRRELRFSPLGNSPSNPKVALVGITPGGQSEAFEGYLRSMSVAQAAKRSAFEGAQTAIKALLRAHGFDSAIGLDLTGDLNDNPDIFTSSLVKCCLRVDGSYKYKAPEIAASPEATYCVKNRFLGDIAKFPSLRWVVIFGEPGWEAVNTLRVGGRTVLERLSASGAEVLNFPHFAQNFQQRAIFALAESEEAAYLAANPKHIGYVHKARVMRRALIAAMARHNGA